MQSDAKGNWHDSKGRFMDKPKRIPNDVAPPMPYQSARDRCIEYAKRQNIDLIWKAASIEVRGADVPGNRRDLRRSESRKRSGGQKGPYGQQHQTGMGIPTGALRRLA